MFAPAFESFVAPARRKPALWRVIAGAALAMAFYLLGTFGLLLAVWSVFVSGKSFMAWTSGISAPQTAGETYILMFTSFPLMAAGVFLAARLFHGRGPGTLFGRAPRVLKDFAIGAVVTLGLGALAFVPAVLIGFDGLPNVEPARWIALLPLTVLAVVIQTGAEEVAFRGYLQQQMAARFRSPIAWLILPSALFGALHWSPDAMGGNAALPVAVAFLFGLFAADLTAKTGSIGAAWGIHFANNFNGIAIISTQGTINGLSLYLTPYSADDPVLLGWSILPSFLMLAAAWYLTRRLTAR